MVDVGRLDEFRIGDVRGRIPAVLDGDQPIAGAMQDERRDVNRHKRRPDVGLLVQPKERQSGRRACAGTQEPAPHLLHLGSKHRRHFGSRTIPWALIKATRRARGRVKKNAQRPDPPLFRHQPWSCLRWPAVGMEFPGRSPDAGHPGFATGTGRDA
jgi:hypothetical protein